MYANDTTLFVVGDNKEEVIDNLNKALSSISVWCGNNKLTIHSEKWECMIMNHKTFYGPFKPVMLGNKVLKFVTETRCHNR